MKIYKIFNKENKIYVLQIGKLTISSRYVMSFGGSYAIGLDAWLQEGYQVCYYEPKIKYVD